MRGGCTSSPWPGRWGSEPRSLRVMTQNTVVSSLLLFGPPRRSRLSTRPLRSASAEAQARAKEALAQSRSLRGAAALIRLRGLRDDLADPRPVDATFARIASRRGRIPSPGRSRDRCCRTSTSRRGGWPRPSAGSTRWVTCRTSTCSAASTTRARPAARPTPGRRRRSTSRRRSRPRGTQHAGARPPPAPWTEGSTWGQCSGPLAGSSPTCWHCSTSRRHAARSSRSAPPGASASG